MKIAPVKSIFPRYLPTYHPPNPRQTDRSKNPLLSLSFSPLVQQHPEITRAYLAFERNAIRWSYRGTSLIVGKSRRKVSRWLTRIHRASRVDLTRFRPELAHNYAIPSCVHTHLHNFKVKLFHEPILNYRHSFLRYKIRSVHVFAAFQTFFGAKG